MQPHRRWLHADCRRIARQQQWADNAVDKRKKDEAREQQAVRGAHDGSAATQIAQGVGRQGQLLGGGHRTCVTDKLLY